MNSLEGASGSMLAIPLPWWWAFHRPGFVRKTFPREELPLASLFPSAPPLGAGSLSSQILFAVVRASLGQLSWNTGRLQQNMQIPFPLTEIYVP